MGLPQGPAGAPPEAPQPLLQPRSPSQWLRHPSLSPHSAPRTDMLSTTEQLSRAPLATAQASPPAGSSLPLGLAQLPSDPQFRRHVHLVGLA